MFLLVISVSFLALSCESPREVPDTYTNTLVLVNPDVGDLSSFLSMMDDNIVDLPDTELHVVHYQPVRNRYETTKEYVEENGYTNVRFEQIEGVLNADNLFQENDCSADFWRIFENSNGALFFGGADFPPVVYGARTNLLTAIRTPFRHYFELSFLFHLLGGSQDTTRAPLLEENPQYVVYGFCLGMQTMSSATGGTMYQDIPTEVYGLKYVEDVVEQDPDAMHRNYWRNLAPREDLIWCNFHRIRFIAERFFISEMDLIPDFNPYVCSSHHQAVKDLGRGFEITAWSMDGKVAEAIAHKKYPNVIGVQFHPEAYAIYSPEAGKHKRSPADTVLVSEYDVINEKNSLDFHKKFWMHFSESF